jgi:Flp pilus assembly protein TadD
MESATQAVSGIYSAYGFVWIAAAHSVQYMWITSYYATATSSGNRAETPGDSSSWPRLRYLVSIAFAGFAIWTIPVLIFAPGVLGSLPHESGLALLVAASVNLHHFVLDGVVWRLRDGRVAQVLLRRRDPAIATAAESLPTRGVSWPSRALWATGALCVALGLFALWEEDVGFRSPLASGDVVRARTAVDRLALIGRDGPKRRTRLGRELAKNGQYRAARIQFARALELQPTADGWGAMALLHEQGLEWVAAARAYQAAAVLDPASPTLRYKTGLCWLEAGEPARAIPALEAAAALAPDEKLIRLSLARARREAARADASATADGAGR